LVLTLHINFPESWVFPRLSQFISVCLGGAQAQELETSDVPLGISKIQ
jgi:hypothetical protein